jgi:hypothetical protein
MTMFYAMLSVLMACEKEIRIIAELRDKVTKQHTRIVELEEELTEYKTLKEVKFTN